MKKQIVFLVAVMSLSGCVSHHRPVVVRPRYKPPKRCRMLGARSTANVMVVVRRNCLRNGLTTVMVVVTNTKNQGKKAVKEATFLMIDMLKFKPKVSLIVLGKIPLKKRKNKYAIMYLFAVTGVNSY